MAFGYIKPAEPDAIFAAAGRAARAREAGLDPIDGTIGVITDCGDPAHPTMLPCVRQAMDSLFEIYKDNPGFPYAPLLGVEAYRAAMQRLVCGTDATVASVATAGGTAAVRLNLDLAKIMGIHRVLLPVPTWPNHLNLLQGSDLPYTEMTGEQLSPPPPEQVLQYARTQSDPVLFLLQANAHNPTGHSWTREQWQMFADGLQGSAHMVLLDCAYMGLGAGVEDDRTPIVLLQEAGVPLLLAVSCSKNHGLYGLRVGWASAVVSSVEEQTQLEQWYRILTRRLYSTASTFGQTIVAAVQEHHAEEWRTQLHDVRTRIDAKRRLLLDAFPDWSESITGSGLFTMLPLSPDQVERLRQQHVFLTDDARVNIAGIPLKRFDEFIDKVRGVL